MKLLLIFTLLSSTILNAQNWEQIQDFPGTPRDDASSFTINNEVFVGLGMDNGFNCQNNFKKFNLVNQSWGDAVSLPINEERQYATSFSSNGKGYIFGGLTCSGEYLSDLWIFDVQTELWTELPSLPSLGRSGMSNFIIEDNVYIVGGKTASSSYTNEVWSFNLTTQLWTQKANLPLSGFWKGIAFTTNSLGYISLGRESDISLNTSTYSYTPDFNTWAPVSGLSISPRSYSCSAQNDTFLFIYGGVNESGEILNDTYRVDLINLESEELTQFPAEERKGGQLFISNHDLFITTGISLTERKKETWKLGQAVNLEQLELETLIYPNPFDDAISVCLKNTSATYTVCNQLGIILKNGIINYQEKQIQLEDLNEGIYFLNLFHSNNVFTYKIVKKNT
jgi:N-acetylneuraminic acid mutarotase